MVAFYVDKNVAIKVVNLLEKMGHIASHARTLFPGQDPGDVEHLTHAAERKYILVTHDVTHFRMLHNAWLR